MLYSAHLGTGNDHEKTLRAACRSLHFPMRNRRHPGRRRHVQLRPLQHRAQRIPRSGQPGSAEAQVSLAVMFENGQGVLRDYKKALMWYRKAADQGHFGAQNNLGLMYAAGAAYRRIRGKRWSGTPRPRIKASRRRRTISPKSTPAVSSARRTTPRRSNGIARRRARDRAAHTDLGSMYENGLGVPKNLAVAYTYFTIAAVGGYEPAVTRRDAVGKQLNAEQREKAAWAAQTWRPGDALPGTSAGQ